MKLANHLDKGFWTLAANVLKALYGVFFTLWMISVLPESAFGRFSLIQATYLIIGQLSITLGMSPYIKYFYETEGRLALQSNALLLALGFAFPVLLGVTLFSTPLAGLLKLEGTSRLVLYVPLLFIASFGKLLSNEIFKATHRLKAFFFTELVYFGGNVILIVGVHLQSTLQAAQDVLLPMCISYGVASLLGLWFVRDLLLPGFTIDRELLRRMYNFGKYNFGTVATASVYNYADIYVVALLLDPAAVALLATVKVANHGFQMYRQAMSLIAFPAFARLFSEDRRADLRAFYEKGVYYSNVVLIALMAALLLGAGFLFDYVLQKYPEGTMLLRLLACSGLFVGWQVMGEALLQGIGKPELPFRVRVVAGALNLVMNLVLISAFGVTGAVWASLAALAFLALAITLFVRREINFSLTGILSRRRDILVYLRNAGQSR